MSDSDAVKPLVNGKMDNIDDEEQKLSVAKEELNTLTKQLEKAEDEKSRLQLAKLSAEDSKKEASKNVMVLQRQGEQRQEEFSKTVKGIQNDISMLEKGNKDLMEKLKKSQAKLRAKKTESATLQQRFKIYVQIPEKKVKFTRKEEDSDDSGQHIKGVFTIAQRPSVLLKGGQALITFEEEKVAAQILKMAKCTVSCDKDKVHLDVSTKTLSFSNVPFTLSEERMRDRLEISFSKPSRGGGEVQRVDYDKHTGRGQITFLNSGVAERLALKRKYIVDMDREVNVKVDLVYNYKLKKFQTFCGTPTRTILLCGIADFQDEEDLQDHLEIHFQKPSNYGGEVECIKYVSGGNEVKAFFTEDMAESEA
ncbi:N-myc-interactor isoform X2 [Oncorhynchus mykiss]|uniref:N-myc-interactor isoform X2 n=1 Tax=Oncorhynchus mykiss TaxID=8022 RepID=UPI0018780F01|nr:N-myc-interactor isoform X2 [Oncorhynchus mykiss]